MSASNIPLIPFLRPAAAVLALALAACAAPAPTPEAKTDPAAARLRTMLDKSDAQGPATASANAAEADANTEAKAKVMAGGTMTLEFVGNAPDLLRRLAAARGLQFRVVGAQPHLPLFVVVDQKGATFEDVLKDVAAQFGQRAQLALTDTAVEIRYRTAQQ